MAAFWCSAWSDWVRLNIQVWGRIAVAFDRQYNDAIMLLQENFENVAPSYMSAWTASSVARTLSQWSFRIKSPCRFAG